MSNKIIESFRRMIDIDMQKGRSWVVDYVVVECMRLGYCAFCGKTLNDTTRPLSTSGGCMVCYSKEMRKASEVSNATD